MDLDESDEDDSGGGCAASNQFKLNLDSAALERFSFLASLIGDQVRCLDGVAGKLAAAVGEEGGYTVARLAAELEGVRPESVKR